MRDEEYLKEQRQRLRDSVEFFTPEKKGLRERWIAESFLRNLNIQFSAPDVVLMNNDPPDVCFRDARFEIKEIMDHGRRRHTEYKEALEKATLANGAAELVTGFTPKDLTLQRLYELVVASSSKHARKYAKSFAHTLDLLFYINLQDIMGLVEEPFPDTSVLQSHPWRSVAFIMGHRACVLRAATVAPPFIKDVVGKVIHREHQRV